MTSDASDQGRFLHATPTSMLLVCALGAALASVLHRSEATSHALNLWMPPLLSLGYATLAVLCWRMPDKPMFWAQSGLYLGILGLAVPAWTFTWQAWVAGVTPLVVALPPISAVLLPLLMLMVLFTPHHRLMATVLVTWAAVAAPVVAYLLAHPAEMLSPRGLDLVITLGPVMLMVVAYIPFHRGMVTRLEQLKVERASAAALAERDMLTGLQNRRAAEAFMQQLLPAANGNDALMVFDIDHFKHINDGHGHPVGDAVLRAVAERVAHRLRKGDLLSRWGGEEFLVLIRGSDLTGAQHLAQELCNAISSAPIGPVPRVSASFGVTLFRPGDSLSSWFDRADQALYAAKSGGRNQVRLG